MTPEIIAAISGVIGAAIGGGAAIISANSTLKKQFESQDRLNRRERIEKVHRALSKIEREGSLIQSTASMREEKAADYDDNWLSNKSDVDELRAIVDLYMPKISKHSEELYVHLTRFWYEHSMALSAKQDGIEPAQNFYDKVVPISTKIQNICAEIKLEIKGEMAK